MYKGENGISEVGQQGYSANFVVVVIMGVSQFVLIFPHNQRSEQ